MKSMTTTKELKLMSQKELMACGVKIPSFKQLSDNMIRRLEKIRGEGFNEENFLIRHSYNYNTARSYS